MFWYYDPTYWMVLIGALIALYAQFRVSAAYSKWSKVPSSTHMTGAQIARQILDGNGCQDVRIEAINGKLTARRPSPRSALRHMRRDTPFRTRKAMRRFASVQRLCRLRISVPARRFRCSCWA